MSVIEVRQFTIEQRPAGDFAVFEAVVEDIVQSSPATQWEPAQFCAAVCTAEVLLSDDFDISVFQHDEEVMELAEDVTDWQPVGL